VPANDINNLRAHDPVNPRSWANRLTMQFRHQSDLSALPRHLAERGGR
jgi:hypothetical protein